MAFWEKWCFLIMKVFCFPSYWSGLKSMKGSEIGVLNPCDDSYFCQLLCQLSQLFYKVVKRVNKQNIFCNFLDVKMLLCMSLRSKTLCKHFLFNCSDDIISTYNPNCTSVINLVYVYQPKYDTSYILLWMQRKMNKGMSESRGVGGAPDLCIFLLIR